MYGNIANVTALSLSCSAADTVPSDTMNLRHVQRFFAVSAAIAVLAGDPVYAWAESPSTGKDNSEETGESASDQAVPTSRAGRMKGRVGLGGMRTLSGVNAIGVRYYPIDQLDIGALIGFATFSHKEAGDDGQFNDKNTVGLLGTGLHVIYWPVQMSRAKYVSADFGFGLRGVVYRGFLGDPDLDKGDRPLEIDIEIPITTALFIGDSVALIPEFGFVARIIPGDREPDQQDNADDNPGSGIGERLGTTNGPGLGFELGEHGGLFFGLSIMYYFGGDKALERRAKRKAKKKASAPPSP